MRIISSGIELEKEFERLIEDYSGFYWAAAWADGNKLKLFKQVKLNQNKIRRIVVGTSFKKTDPSFISEFMHLKNVRFDKNSEGVFHPKVYLFTKGEKWEIIIGSANFTNGAFRGNREIVLLLESTSDNDGKIKESVKNEIEGYWNKSSVFKQDELDEYTKAHNKMLKAQEEILSNAFLKINKNTTWDKYLRIVRTGQSFDDRMKLLQTVRGHFKKSEHLKNMDYTTNSMIAGYVKGEKTGIDWRMFGNTQEPGSFSHIVKTDIQKISDALDEIPLEGDVDKRHYDAFIAKFEPLFKKSMIVHASRLLAMKRPDIFYCITKRNSHRFFYCYPTKNYRKTYTDYWEYVVLKIHHSNWWQSDKPSSGIAREIWDNRVALLDAVYYNSALE